MARSTSTATANTPDDTRRGVIARGNVFFGAVYRDKLIMSILKLEWIAA